MAGVDPGLVGQDVEHLRGDITKKRGETLQVVLRVPNPARECQGLSRVNTGFGRGGVPESRCCDGALGDGLEGCRAELVVSELQRVMLALDAETNAVAVVIWLCAVRCDVLWVDNTRFGEQFLEAIVLCA